MASLEKLQNEILLKEEAFLREEKAKLMEQLNKLKVEEMALMKLLEQDSVNPQQTTMELFSKTSQVSSSSSLKIDEVNHIPLQGLKTTEMNNDIYQGEEEEEDEDDMNDDEPAYSQQLLNAISNMHQQNNNVDLDISRSVLENVLQQEIEGFDDDDEEEYLY